MDSGSYWTESGLLKTVVRLMAALEAVENYMGEEHPDPAKAAEIIRWIVHDALLHGRKTMRGEQ